MRPKSAFTLVLRKFQPGNSFSLIGEKIYRYAMLKGYSVVYQYCGHGVGLEFHEEPQLNHAGPTLPEAKMEPGMIFTIEPMICTKGPDAVILKDDWTAVTADGGLSAQYEHTVLVTPDGHEVLTCGIF